MATSGFLFDEALTECVLTLAGPDVADEKAAEALFRSVWKGRKPWVASLDDESMRTYSTDDLELAQKWLRDWLPRILDSHRLAESSAAAFAREFNTFLDLGNPAPPGLRLGRRLGDFELTIDAQHDSLWGASVRGVLPFLLPYGWQRRLGRCELKGCTRWFLRKYQTGPRQQYCTEEHAQAARARRYRGRRA